MPDQVIVECVNEVMLPLLQAAAAGHVRELAAGAVTQQIVPFAALVPGAV